MLQDPDVFMQCALDTFTTVWHQAKHFEPEKLSAKAWLVAVCYRTALNHKRGSDNELMPLQTWNMPSRPDKPAKAHAYEYPLHKAVASLSQEARGYLELARESMVRLYLTGNLSAVPRGNLMNCSPPEKPERPKRRHSRSV